MRDSLVASDIPEMCPPLGLKPNMYQFSVQQVIAIDDLFS